MAIVRRHPLVVGPLPLRRQLAPRRGRLAARVRVPARVARALVRELEGLQPLAAVRVFEAEFEDPVVVDAALADVVADRLGPDFVAVQPEGEGFGLRVLAGALQAADDSAFGFGAGVGEGGPEFDRVVDAHCFGLDVWIGLREWMNFLRDRLRDRVESIVMGIYMDGESSIHSVPSAVHVRNMKGREWRVPVEGVHDEAVAMPKWLRERTGVNA